MEYIRRVDLNALEQATERTVQMVLTHDSGATTCKIMASKSVADTGSPRGLHTHDVDQIFFILSGSIMLEIDGSEYEAKAGDLVIQPAGVLHRNWNPEGTSATFIEVMTPLPAFGSTMESDRSYVKDGVWVNPQ